MPIWVWEVRDMVSDKNRRYAEYFSYVENLIDTPEMKRLEEFSHHYGVSRLRHCINVSYYSFLVCKKLGLDYGAAARGGLLHDLFFYECAKKRFGAFKHAALHPKLAFRNAEKLTALSPIEKDIILKHMCMSSLVVPRYRESYIVSFVDKYCAIWEAAYGLR
ncbi:MAG: hypothetical protein RR957_06945 [Oscillospiraceae bacterium]